MAARSGFLSKATLGLIDDDVALLDEVAYPAHRVERGLDHGERLLLTRLELLFFRGVIFGANGAGTHDDHVRPARPTTSPRSP